MSVAVLKKFVNQFSFKTELRETKKNVQVKWVNNLGEKSDGIEHQYLFVDHK